METWIVITGWGARLVLLLLLCLSVWSIAVIIDRAKTLKRVLNREDSVKIKELISNLEWKALSEFVSSKTSLQSGMVKAALGLNSTDPDRIEHLSRSYLTEHKSDLEKGFTVLATLGSNAPFIGLFGTVLGIIQAFGVLGQKQASGTSVMTGISEALIATAVGLFVAIPAVVAFNVFSRKLKIIVTDCESLKEYFLSHIGLTQDSLNQKNRNT